MNPIKPPKNEPRLGALLSLLLDAEIADDEFRELTEILRRSEDARNYYLEYLSIHNSLGIRLGSGLNLDQLANQVESPPSFDPTDTFSNSHETLPFPKTEIQGNNKFGHSWWGIQSLLSIIVLLLASNLVFSIWNVATREKATVQTTAPEDTPENLNVVSPQLVSMTACVWRPSPGSRPATVGQVMEFGEVLDLAEGIAEFKVTSSSYSSDRARVRIEGPASIYVRSDGQFGLRYGVMTAEVECQESRFVVDTPMGNVAISENASIGLMANGSDNQVHIFDGKAVVETTWSAHGETELLLNQGEAVKLANLSDRAGEMVLTRFDASTEAFVSKRTMAFDRLRPNLAYQQVVLESKPQIYWRFDENDNLENSITTMKASVEGEISWRQSGDNRAAEFGLTSSGGVLVGDQLWPEKPLESYAIEFWVKPSHFHNGAIIGMIEPTPDHDGRFRHGMFLEIGGPFHMRNSPTPGNRYRFVHRSPPSDNRSLGSWCFSDDEYQVRMWQHVVANKTKDSLQLFVNGKLAGFKEDSTSLSPGLKLVIGELYHDQSKWRRFIGQIDEVAVYDRSLSVEEIARHYETARPSKSRSNPNYKENL